MQYRNPQVRLARRVGVICLLLGIALWSLSLPLHCAGRAAVVAAFALMNGAVMGVLLALVTRVRHPALIYLFLGTAALTLWPLIASWPLDHGRPFGDPWTIQAWTGASPLVYSYYDLLRACLFVLGIPAPFARFGQHAPDSYPANTQASESDAAPCEEENTHHEQSSTT